MENEIPDKIPGMTMIPIRMKQLTDALMAIATGCEHEFPNDPKPNDVMIECMELFKKRYPGKWGPASMFLLSIMLVGLIKVCASEIVINHDDD